MHVYSQFIPTIERVNLDLQDPYIKIWNKDILRSAGKIIRLIYDEMINVKLENYNRILALYSFQSTVPNTEISLLKFLLFYIHISSNFSKVLYYLDMHRTRT
jgi:hypothetical protein